jgi:protein-tyrosine phosphatase
MGSKCTTAKSDKGAKGKLKHKHPALTTKIDQYLYLGNLGSATNKDHLKELSIKNIVELYGVEPDPELEQSITFLRAPIKGGTSTDIQPIVDDIIAFIQKSISKQENVLVHCKHGKNRAASIIAAYLMARYHLDYEQALDFLTARRPNIKIKGQAKEFLMKTPYQQLEESLNKRQ